MNRDAVIEEMKKVFQEIPYGITHTLQVLSDTETILDGENITGRERDIAKIAAILHDIGAVEALRVHGSIDGPYQELEGPAVAQEILNRLECEPEFVERVAYIVGHHHTPSAINGLDFQAVWEADQLAAMEHMEPEGIESFINDNFRTETGKALARNRMRNG